MKILKRVFSFWCLIWVSVIYIVIFPSQFVFLQRRKWYPTAHFLNKVWTRVFFYFSFIRTRFVYKFKPDKNSTYIYCPNHSSYLDIPVSTLAIPGYAKYIGKSSLTKVPLFGYMFSRLHISVDRDKRFSRYRSMIKCFYALDHGISVVIFPEGTIPQKGLPKMIPFKDGPFRIAIEKKVPVVPVTMPYNRQILPDDGKYLIKPGRVKVIIHQPIETKGMSVKDIGRLKKEVFEIIEKQLSYELRIRNSVIRNS